jgi:antitoxin (DNA-binding transcriptional repressor) of toxin-antitoxin stability system
MKTYNVHEAKTHFSAILALVAAGEEVVVARAGTPVAIIRAYRQDVPRRSPGQVKLEESFFEPMEPEFLEHFEWGDICSTPMCSYGGQMTIPDCHRRSAD